MHNAWDNSEFADAADPALWPSEDYYAAVARLRAAVGRPVYIVEAQIGATQASAALSDRSYELLAVLDFPRPDPRTRLYPHYVLLDDGRGINLGRLVRISLNTAFDPPAEDVLFLEDYMNRRLLHSGKDFDPLLVAAKSRATLGMLLGKSPAEMAALTGPTPPVALPQDGEDAEPS